MVIIRKGLKNQNIFLSYSEKSIIKFHTFSKAVMGKLESHRNIPEIEIIYNDSKPIFDVFDMAYSTIGSSKYLRIGDTTQQNILFKKLRKEYLPKWEATVIMNFTEETSEFRSIFPYGRAPFSKVRKDKIIVNLNSFLDVIKLYSPLSALAIEVEQIRDSLVKARDNKLSKDGGVDGSITSLKTAALKLAIRHYRNLGKFMDFYAETPEEIEKFFPMKFLKNHHKSTAELANTLKVTIFANTIIEAGINFNMDSILLIGNISDANVKVWFSQTKDMIIPANAIVILADDEAEIEVKNYAGIDDRFMMIANTSLAELAVIEITLLDNGS